MGWGVLLAYLVFAGRYCSKQQTETICTGLNITVKDSTELKFITPAVVRNILISSGLVLTGAQLDTINPIHIERAIAKRAYVKRVSAYTSMDGKVNIEVEQRRPILRVQSANGYHFYVSEDHCILPIQRYFFVDVPIVTGVPQFVFGTNFAGAIPIASPGEKKSPEYAIFLENLINFVRFLQRDSFWGTQVVQINVLAGNQVELIPRVGNAVILLGDLEEYGEKLNKLFKFYTRGLAYEGWNKYRSIDIRFKDQVICTL